MKSLYHNKFKTMTRIIKQFMQMIFSVPYSPIPLFLIPLFLITLISLLPLNSISQTIEVKQDSTGDYTQIQEAIDHAWPGDTVLVWPGTYFENIDFIGKNITLGSLMMTTGDETYKHNTIIDGGMNGSCIYIKNVANTTFIHGLSIKNGQSINGGGIYVYSSNVNIENCIITKNMTFGSGAGICSVIDCEIKITGNSIYDNHSYDAAGGIMIAVDSYCEFDSINRNSIYSNYAERGCEITVATESQVSTIYLDTCTVLKPETYFVISLDPYGYPLDNLTIEVQNAVLQPIDSNLYVNPVTGNNDNIGTTPKNPLRTIAFALTKIHIDSLEKNTIYLADGIYSDTTNDEKFPLNTRPFINIIGESQNGTILDGNRTPRLKKLIKGNNSITDFSYKKMTLRGSPILDYDNYYGCRLARLYTGCDRFILDSIVFEDSYAYDATGILAYYQADSSMVKNCIFRNNTGGYAIRTGADGNKTHFINNIIVTNQQPDENVPPNCLKMGKVIGDGGDGKTIVQNSLFYNNPRLGVSRSPYGNSYFANCTFANNGWYDDYAFIAVSDASMHLYNCIAWDLGPKPIAISVGEWWKFEHSYLNIYNSLIEGGEESITVADECWHSDSMWCHVHYDPTNIDADPNFLGMWGDPYMIADGSPCIDAGTLANLPDFIELPEFDLAGNPRIVGDSIDMGAYEWNETIVGFNEIGPSNRNEKPKLLKASPNPFDWGTYIEVKVEAEVESRLLSGEIKVEVYDNYGNLVRNILSTTLNEKQEILWYGDNNNGNPLPAGIYHVVMFSGEREIESLKVVKR